jgi:hypothetical protein
MISKYPAILISFTLFFLMLGCSVSKETSAYTSEEIDFDRQVKKHISNIQSHIHNFDTISKNAKPPYNDPTLLSNLQNELDQAVQEGQAMTDLNCPSSKFERICGDLVSMRNALANLRDDLVLYYASGLDASFRQKINNDMKDMTTSSQNVADDYSQLEEQYGKIK